MEEFRVSWSQTDRCFRGGKPRLKPEVKNPLKRHNAPGSRRCGCPAEIRARLMVTKSGLSLLESLSLQFHFTRAMIPQL